MIKCDSCAHEKMCKYKEEFIECAANIEKLNKPDFMKVSFDCKYYSESKPTPKEFKLPNFTTTSTNSRKDCNDCDFYNKYILKGQTYIGDSPCQWCDKYPFRVTCDSNSDITCIN